MTGREGEVVDAVGVPYELLQWADSEDANSVIERLYSQASVKSIEVVKPRPGKASFQITATSNESLRSARLLLEENLKHQVEYQLRKQQTERMEEDLRATNAEFESGQRVEFSIPENLIGLVIGKGGARVTKVKEETGVERVFVDTNSRVVRIRGRDPEAVKKARAMLEYVEVAMPLTQGQARIVIGERRRNIAEITRKSGCVNITVEKDHFLRFVGTKSCVRLAQDLVETHLDYEEKITRLRKDELQIQKQLSKIDADFRDYPAAMNRNKPQRREAGAQPTQEDSTSTGSTSTAASAMAVEPKTKADSATSTNNNNNNDYNQQKSSSSSAASKNSNNKNKSRGQIQQSGEEDSDKPDTRTSTASQSTVRQTTQIKDNRTEKAPVAGTPNGKANSADDGKRKAGNNKKPTQELPEASLVPQSKGSEQQTLSVNAASNSIVNKEKSGKSKGKNKNNNKASKDKASQEPPKAVKIDEVNSEKKKTGELATVEIATTSENGKKKAATKKQSIKAKQQDTQSKEPRQEEQEKQQTGDTKQYVAPGKQNKKNNSSNSSKSSKPEEASEEKSSTQVPVDNTKSKPAEEDKAGVPLSRNQLRRQRAKQQKVREQQQQKGGAMTATVPKNESSKVTKEVEVAPATSTPIAPATASGSSSAPTKKNKSKAAKQNKAGKQPQSQPDPVKDSTSAAVVETSNSKKESSEPAPSKDKKSSKGADSAEELGKSKSKRNKKQQNKSSADSNKDNSTKEKTSTSQETAGETHSTTAAESEKQQERGQPTGSQQASGNKPKRSNNKSAKAKQKSNANTDVAPATENMKPNQPSAAATHVVGNVKKQAQRKRNTNSAIKKENTNLPATSKGEEKI
mmetsp:Transcript_21682/g.42589  ORF Transcript_21682/g.42589 Transcript_21682/m.42589 type:complete len:858 (-) Transcript_21682:1312-3885(-)|eukprot:CAMPEP_0171498056 /NCGR_PEP_ID=MMETSP0958-20121227/7628_1 /TAXON_ID=87120 /ORGANISM="Aurantiochytrium limacinum, Strain ATCCMYA-1381" /LENGTH=857 /DNA_ID=CAMNT_0012032393 /DNA_START=392 /DNA_END=2965 /DNA_ORIENTATION=+